MQGTVDGRQISVGGPALLEHLDASEPDELGATIERWRRTGGSVLYVFSDKAVVGALTLADEIRPESRVAVDALHERGKHVVLITGDAQQVAEVLPQDKDSKAAELRARGLAVAMVGDPRGVLGIIDLSAATYTKMIQNLVWATAYNILGILIAAGAFAFAGLTLPPAAAALAMSASTMIVAANAKLLRRLDFRPDPLPDAEPAPNVVGAAWCPHAIALIPRLMNGILKPMTTETRTYTVPDISCDHCKRSIESAVSALPHVEAVEVDVAAKTVTVTGGDPAATEAAIGEAGYAIA